MSIETIGIFDKIKQVSKEKQKLINEKWNRFKERFYKRTKPTLDELERKRQLSALKVMDRLFK